MAWLVSAQLLLRHWASVFDCWLALDEENSRMKLTIDRAMWSFGKGHGRTSLLTPDGQKDVLGFFAMACGADDVQLMNKCMVIKDNPTSIDVAITSLTMPESVTRLTNVALFSLAEMNDKPEVKNEDRELLIKEGFEKIGVQVKFVGKYPRKEHD